MIKGELANLSNEQLLVSYRMNVLKEGKKAYKEQEWFIEELSKRFNLDKEELTRLTI